MSSTGLHLIFPKLPLETIYSRPLFAKSRPLLSLTHSQPIFFYLISFLLAFVRNDNLYAYTHRRFYFFPYFVYSLNETELPPCLWHSAWWRGLTMRIKIYWALSMSHNAVCGFSCLIIMTVTLVNIIIVCIFTAKYTKAQRYFAQGHTEPKLRI